MNSIEINNIFQRFQENNPNPQIELNYINHFTLLIAVLLSAQSTDIMVNKVTKDLFNIISSPSDVIAFGEENLKNNIRKIGLFNTKAKNIIALSHILIDKYDGIVPDNFDELILLPGIGRKSANVILSVLFKINTIAVDTHVFRVSNRIGLVKTNNVLNTEKKLLELIDSQWLRHAHHWLVLHGRYICQAKKPKCSECFLKDICKSYQVFVLSV
ncbi:MAG: endonuclease III [Anaplasmataceae bacterium]|nr:endonuclease III [Anaplasmataceae bacterium]